MLSFDNEIGPGEIRKLSYLMAKVLLCISVSKALNRWQLARGCAHSRRRLVCKIGQGSTVRIVAVWVCHKSLSWWPTQELPVLWFEGITRRCPITNLLFEHRWRLSTQFPRNTSRSTRFFWWWSKVTVFKTSLSFRRRYFLICHCCGGYAHRYHAKLSSFVGKGVCLDWSLVCLPWRTLNQMYWQAFSCW